MTHYSQVYFNVASDSVNFIASESVNKTVNKAAGNDSLAELVTSAANDVSAAFDNRRPKILIVGYSPTGGGHTGRVLNIVSEALQQGDLPPDSQVIFHVPPVWENMPRPAQLTELANQLIKVGVNVKFFQSEKPVYGYLNPLSGGSDDARITERFGLQALRNDPRTEKNAFLECYYPEIFNAAASVSQVNNFAAGDNIENLTTISADNLIKSIAEEHNGDTSKLYILADMDPAALKAARKNGVPEKQAMDQQNHGILLGTDDEDDNLSLRNALLAKVLDARGANISHISLGRKNTLSSMLSTTAKLGIDAETTLQAGKQKINQLLVSAAKPAPQRIEDVTKGWVLKGQGVEQPEDIEKVVYVYAHKKTSIIARHIAAQIAEGNKEYHNKIFVFCGPNAVAGYNALHLAMLADADGITTSGAGTCGEFVYLHRHAGAKSDVFILPIEGHNEQEAIADALCREFPDNMLRLEAGETLEDGTKIDLLVARRHAVYAENNYGSFIRAVSQESTYVRQGLDILFNRAEMDEEAKVYQRIEHAMYQDRDIKATRLYLKLYFQLVNYLSVPNKSIIFPIAIKFKSNASPAIILNNSEEVKDLLNDNQKLRKIIDMSSANRVNSLPLLKDVRELMSGDLLTLSKEKINNLNDKLGHYMATGF